VNAGQCGLPPVAALSGSPALPPPQRCRFGRLMERSARMMLFEKTNFDLITYIDYLVIGYNKHALFYFPLHKYKFCLYIMIMPLSGHLLRQSSN
jgi:hypothetical protein